MQASSPGRPPSCSQQPAKSPSSLPPLSASRKPRSQVELVTHLAPRLRAQQPVPAVARNAPLRGTQTGCVTGKRALVAPHATGCLVVHRAQRAIPSTPRGPTAAAASSAASSSSSFSWLRLCTFLLKMTPSDVIRPLHGAVAQSTRRHFGVWQGAQYGECGKIIPLARGSIRSPATARRCVAPSWARAPTHPRATPGPSPARTSPHPGHTRHLHL